MNTRNSIGTAALLASRLGVCQAEIKLMGLRKEIKKLSKWLCAEAPSLFTKAGCKALGELSNGRNDEGRSIEADQFAEVVVRRRRRYKAWLAKRRNSGLAEHGDRSI